MAQTMSTEFVEASRAIVADECITGTLEIAPEFTNLRKPLRLEGLSRHQVTALIVQLDDLRRDMRYTAGQAKRNP
jgi:hypothetical protein